MKAHRLRAGLVVLASVAVILAAFLGPRVAVADESELRDALQQYEEGNYDQALEQLRAYVASNPGNEEVYAVLRDAEEKALLRALTQGGEHERLMKYLLDKARPMAREEGMDEARIQGLARQAVESDALDERRRAGMQLRAAGAAAVPHLYAYLGSEDAPTVVNAMFALHRVGSQGTLALVEVLEADDARLAGNAAAVLGDIGDRRAVPGLKRLHETSDDPYAQEKAREALLDIVGEQVLGFSASDLYVGLGHRFYRNDPTVISDFGAVKDLWRWEDGELARYEVPAYLYPYQMAEQMAVDAIDLSAGNDQARALLVRTLLGQKVEADVLRTSGGEPPESLDGAYDVAASQGFRAATDALAGSLADEDWDVAIEIMPVLVDTYGNEPLAGHPLGDALIAPERRVRYNAAIAALHMSPKSGLPNADKVATLAAQAASESAVRQVLVIDDREGSRSRLVMDLAHGGYVAASEATGGGGVNRAKNSPTLDVIVIRADLGDPDRTIPSRRLTSSIMVIDELKSDARTRDMRILVLLQDTEESKVAALREFFENKYGDDVAGFITMPIDTTTVVETVNEAAEAGDLSPDQERANALAARAAGAFAETDFSCASFNLAVAVEPLSTAATEGPTSEVRLHAVRALGNLRVGGADALLSVLQEGEDEEIQAAAATALGSVLSVMDATDAHVDALISAAEGDGAVADAALKALGSVRDLTPEQRLRIFKAHRLGVAERAGS